MASTGVSTAPGSVVGRRVAWVDNVRVLVIAGVIVVHTATAYVVDLASWYYDDERADTGIWSTIVTVPAFFGAVFALGPLFLLAGWFAQRSVAHRGPAAFARSRLVRLGVPTLVFLLVIQPLTDYLGNLWDEDRSFASYLRSTEVSVMWFAVAVLVCSLVYAGWERLRVRRPAPRPLRWTVLVTAAAVIGLGSFAVWAVWPLDDTRFLNLRVPAWPQGAVLFALGVQAARAGWVEKLGRRTQRRLGWIVVVAAVTLVSLLAVALGGDKDLATRTDWPTLAFAVLYGVIAVSFTFWSVAWLQRRWPAHGPLLDKAAQASYATYVIHPLVLTLVMLGCAAVPLPPEVKFVLVAAVGVPTCFAVGYTLTRLPGASTVL